MLHCFQVPPGGRRDQDYQEQSKMPRPPMLEERSILLEDRLKSPTSKTRCNLATCLLFDFSSFSDLQVQWGFAKLGCGKDIHLIQQSESIRVFQQFTICNSVGSLGRTRRPQKNMNMIFLENININHQDIAYLEFRWVFCRKDPEND